ncbi:MAG: stage II sporulation protein P [Clostridia bacterium]|nr:stage II sporulation protein P [Clostridia bacterium]
MNKKQIRRRIFRRLAALAAVIGVLALPIDWSRLGKQAALVAAGLRQPARAAGLLEQQLSPGTDSPTAPTQPTPPIEFAPPGDTTGVDIPVAAPAVTLPPMTRIPPPGEKGDGGRVAEKKMDTGDRHKYGIATINRSGTAVDIAAALGRELALSFEKTDAPQVLILHTHTTEGYMTYDAGYYNADDRNRTQDHTRNVCAVGEAVRLTLAAYGIVAIHDTTVHDSPVYSGAYNRSAATAQSYLEQHPTIRVVLDLHRDAVMQGDTDIVKPTASVAGKKAAQMMLITGVVSTDALPHPHWQDNLTFSTHLQQALDAVSPDLMRPLNTVASRYNQHLSPGWVLVEVGSEGNTVEEAVYAGQILARTLADLLD